ncbi:retropepsin-like aspartic protease [Paraprevotella clara]|uniref:retropepsin-like aspartic protease n=1 Tax=Paraprevotella clara TaxID=454154 RepID=UPI0026752E91|nr:retropepsin-like aspartic protease [Paraprevotella clara]
MKVIYHILFLLSALFHYHLIYGQETDYDKKVTELINMQDWSAANEVMQNHKNNISQETAQIAQILINTNMNRSVKAISELKKLLEQEIEDDNWFLFLNGILLENYDNLHDYQSSQSICTNLLNSKRFPKEIQEDIARRKAAYQSLTNHPKFQVKKIRPDTCFAYTYMPFSHTITSISKCNGIDASFIFDTGSSMSVINESSVGRLKIRVLQNDSILINGTTYGIRGLIDSLQIGNYIFYNYPITILPSKKHKFSIEDSILSNKVKATINHLENTDLILGMSCLRFIEECQINTKKMNITLPYKSSNFPMKLPMQLPNNRLYLKTKINDINFIGFFDTGSESSIHINNSFYKKNSHKLPMQGNTSQTIRTLEFNGPTILSVYPLQPVQTNIVKKPLKEVFVLPQDEYDHDGDIGNFIFKETDNIIFNFKEMWIHFEERKEVKNK